MPYCLANWKVKLKIWDAKACVFITSSVVFLKKQNVRCFDIKPCSASGMSIFLISHNLLPQWFPGLPASALSQPHISFLHFLRIDYLLSQLWEVSWWLLDEGYASNLTSPFSSSSSSLKIMASLFKLDELGLFPLCRHFKLNTQRGVEHKAMKASWLTLPHICSFQTCHSPSLFLKLSYNPRPHYMWHYHQLLPETSPWQSTWGNRIDCKFAWPWAWVHTCISTLPLAVSLHAWILPHTQSSASGSLHHRTWNTQSKGYVPSSKANREKHIIYLCYYALLSQVCEACWEKHGS